MSTSWKIITQRGQLIACLRPKSFASNDSAPPAPESASSSSVWSISSSMEPPAWKLSLVRMRSVSQATSAAGRENRPTARNAQAVRSTPAVHSTFWSVGPPTRSSQVGLRPATPPSAQICASAPVFQTIPTW